MREQRFLRPALAAAYAYLLPALTCIAREHGYCLATHGSMATDLDIVLCPWVDAVATPEVVVEAIREYIGGVPCNEARYGALPEKKPRGRLAWSFYFNGADALRSSGPYIDISVMPCGVTTYEDAA